MNNILKTIYICYKGKNKPLDIQYYGNYAYWCWKDDAGFCKYSKAMERLQRCQILYKILKKMHIV